MRYIKAVACPVCGAMNNVPDNLEQLLKTEVFRGDREISREQLKFVSERLKDLGQSIRDHILSILKTRRHSDPNDWIDVECVNAKAPYGRHTFRYHTGTGELAR